MCVMRRVKCIRHSSVVGFWCIATNGLQSVTVYLTKSRTFSTHRPWVLNGCKKKIKVFHSVLVRDPVLQDRDPQWFELGLNSVCLKISRRGVSKNKKRACRIISLAGACL